MSNVKRTPHHEDAVLGEESMSHDNTVKFKVGDKVKLRPETKPYTYLMFNGKVAEKRETLKDGFIYTIQAISDDGDIHVNHDGLGLSAVRPIHLKHAKQDYNDNPYRFEYAVGGFDSFKSRMDTPCNDIDTMELRLAIFNAKPNRTLEEMQDIEKWLLNK